MKRILVIENESIIRNFLSSLLSRFGYAVTQAKSGSEGLEKINEGEFDGIFLDIHLNDMSGKDIHQQLKERSADLSRRIVFVTGDLRNPKTESFVKETGNLCLEKPFTITEVKTLLNQFFQQKIPCG